MADRFEQRRGPATTFWLSREEWEQEHQCPVGLQTDGRSTYSDAYLVVWELMKMLWLVSRVHSYNGNRVLDRYTPRPPSTTKQVDANERNQGSLESAVAVFFRMFEAEETLLTAYPLECPPKTLITHPAVRETKEDSRGDGKLPCSVTMVVFFGHVFNHSGRPNHIEAPGFLVPPLKPRLFNSGAFEEDQLSTNIAAKPCKINA